MKLFLALIISAMFTMALIGSVQSPVLALPQAHAKSESQLPTRLADILERSGYTYRKAADNVWLVNFKGSSLNDFQVLVTSAENLVIIGVVVAKKNSMNATPEMMFKLLRLVHEIDRVKIGFDEDEDLFLRAEVTAKCFDLEEFKTDIEQVAAGADKVHAQIKSYLK
jgi:hypothetical protein